MKKIFFTLLLFCSLFENIISNKGFKKGSIKNIFNKSIKMKKLISKAKSINTKKNKEINSSKRSLEEKTKLSKNIDNKTAGIQIIKFYNYTNDKENKKIKFNTYFYFLKQKIPNIIKFNITITYESNGQAKVQSPEKVIAICDLSNGLWFNKDGKGDTISYNCSSEIDLIAFKIKSVSIDINTQMELVYNETKKTIDFKDINFNGDSAKESENLQDNIIQLDYLVELNDAQFVGYNKNYFIINGILDSPIASTNDKLVSMSFMNITGKNKECKTYNCIVNMDKKNNLLISLGCDVDNNPINTTINYLHLSSGISSGNNTLVIKMKDLSDMPIEFPIKNESGLNITANYPPFDIDENSKISKESKKIDNKDALLQIVKFYNYTYDENNNIQFISDFYFSGIKIMQEITFRLNVFYENTGIRRLDLAESIQSTCSLREEDLIMTYYIGNGKIYNYTCIATPNKNISNIKKVKINTDIPMIAAGIDGYEIIDFRDINFKGDSSQESENLNEIITINKKAELKKAYIIIVERDYFKIGGVLDNNETIKDNDTLKMLFINQTKDKSELSEYFCNASVYLDGVTTELTCDTKKHPINTTLRDIHLSLGISMKNNTNVIYLKMKNWRDNIMKINSVAAGKSTRKYHPKSGGLSKGAIAGIVIGIVVAIIVIMIILLVVFRKSPPAPEKNINNSSVNKFESTDKI